MRIRNKAKIVKDKEVVAYLPTHALDSLPTHQDNQYDFSGVNLGRQESFPCAKRSFWGSQVVVSVIRKRLPQNRVSLAH